MIELTLLGWVILIILGVIIGIPAIYVLVKLIAAAVYDARLDYEKQKKANNHQQEEDENG